MYILTDDSGRSRERPFLNGPSSDSATILGTVENCHVEEGVWSDPFKEWTANVGQFVDLRFQKFFLIWTIKTWLRKLI